MCKCLAIIARITIGILSVIFTILGFALLVIGIMVKVQADAINQLFQPLLESAKSQASAAVDGTFDLPTDNFNIAELVGGLATAFIVVGVIFLAIGVFGVAGACCMVKCMIIVYLIIVGAIFLAMIIVVIIVSVNRPIITDPPKAELKSMLQKEYGGINDTDVTSILWNVIMTNLECCGIDGSSDFDSATQWRTTWGPDSSRVPPFQTPAACCKADALTDTDRTCAEAPTTLNNNMNVGCYDKVWDFILTGTAYIAFCCVTIGGFGLLTFFAAVILYDIITKSKSSGMV